MNLNTIYVDGNEEPEKVTVTITRREAQYLAVLLGGMNGRDIEAAIGMAA